MTNAAGILQDFDASCLGPMTTANAKAAEACIFKNAPNRFLQLRNEVQQQLLVSRDMPYLPVGLSAHKCAMIMQACSQLLKHTGNIRKQCTQARPGQVTHAKTIISQVPEGERQSYSRPREHLKGSDVALLERVAAEYQAAHGPALTALGITIDQIKTLSRQGCAYHHTQLAHRYSA